MAIFITAVLVLLYTLWALWWRRGSDAGGSMQMPGFSKKKPRKACKWLETGEAKGRFVEYRCEICDVVALSHTGRPPQDCKKVLSS